MGLLSYAPTGLASNQQPATSNQQPVARTTTDRAVLILSSTLDAVSHCHFRTKGSYQDSPSNGTIVREIECCYTRRSACPLLPFNSTTADSPRVSWSSC